MFELKISSLRINWGTSRLSKMNLLQVLMVVVVTSLKDNVGLNLNKAGKFIETLRT